MRDYRLYLAEVFLKNLLPLCIIQIKSNKSNSMATVKSVFTKAVGL